MTKVLAGDRLACRLLGVARSLPEPEWDALAQRCEWTLAYVPAAVGYSGVAACAGIDGKAWTLAAGVPRGRPLALLALLRRLLPLPRDNRKVYWPVTNAADGCGGGAQVDMGTVDASDEVPVLEVAPV